jgi:photosystem II stability/assembly factor-like uncharacterized protein
MRPTPALVTAVLLVAFPLGLAAQQAPGVVEQVSGVQATLQSVSAVDANTAWAGGSGGMVLRTVDGGDHWERKIITGAERLEFRGIVGLSATEAWAMSAGSGAGSRIYHTANGGESWTSQFVNADSSAFYDCITFFDRLHGIAFSDASKGLTVILRTADGGIHWSTLPANAAPAPLSHEGGFASSNGCAVSADSRHAWIAAGIPGARIFRTSDAGTTWTLAPKPTPFVHDSQAGITAVFFRDARHGIGVAGRVDRNMTRDTSGNAVATTDDGGVTWTLRPRPDRPGLLSGVTLLPDVSTETVLVAGYGGLFLSRDKGDHWTTLAPNYYWAVRAAGKRAWAVGARGRITRIDF